MSTYKIDGYGFYEAVRAGAAQLMANKNELNNINVFPVADGDTGSNMSATLTAIVEYMERREALSEVTSMAAEGALIGARGNSGMILAQFFYAFAAESKNFSNIELEQFIQSVKKASAKLYEVVLNPMEGTILTLITQWASSMEERYSDHENMKEFSQLVLKDLKEALFRTPSQLPILKEKGVVDSGAKGFYHFLEGVHLYISKEQPQVVAEVLESTVIPKAFHDHFAEGEPLNYRYCCEALLQGKAMDPQKIKAQMADYGDSMVLAGGSDKLRIHLHTNEPEAMFAALSQLGKMSQMKADDMALQSAIMEKTLGKVAIVTDSIADLPEDFSLKNQVSIIPLNLEIDDIDYLDRISMSTHRFYAINEHIKNQPKSSLPSIKQVESLLTFLTNQFEAVLVLSVSDKLSGTYEMVSSVARLIDPVGEKIRVFNTLKNSGAQGLLVLKATELSQKGCTLQEIEEILMEKVHKTQIYVAVHTTKYLARSGRVSLSLSKVAKWIHLKPIMTLDAKGYGKAYGAAIRTDATLKKIKKEIAKTLEKQKIERYNIVHAAAPEKAAHFADEMSDLIGFPPAYIAEISPIVGAVAGEGAVAISYMLK